MNDLTDQLAALGFTYVHVTTRPEDLFPVGSPSRCRAYSHRGEGDAPQFIEATGPTADEALTSLLVAARAA